MHRLAIITTLLLTACRYDLDGERALMLSELCESYCPDRIACVDDGLYKGDVDTCIERCAGEERMLEDNACGEASFAALECLAGLRCDQLPTAVRAVASNTETIACRAELLKQQDSCDFTPRY